MAFAECLKAQYTKIYEHTVPGITPQTFGKHGDLSHSCSGTATTQLNCQLSCDLAPCICRPIRGLTDLLTTTYSNWFTFSTGKSYALHLGHNSGITKC